MNCDRYRDFILLRDSGELGAGERQELERHLDRCGDCADAARSLAFVRSACADRAPAPATPAATLALLTEAARRGSVRPGFLARVAARPVPVLALAASLLVALGLAVGAIRLRTGSGEGGPGLAAASSLDDLDLSLDVLDLELAAVGYDLDSAAGVEEWAREILSLEGGQT